MNCLLRPLDSRCYSQLDSISNIQLPSAYALVSIFTSHTLHFKHLYHFIFTSLIVVVVVDLSSGPVRKTVKVNRCDFTTVACTNETRHSHSFGSAGVRSRMSV